LNEMLPNPDGKFGDDADDAPLGEWIELYNNSATQNIDINGWYILDKAGNKVNILLNNTYDFSIMASSTIIKPHGWLVVFMNKSFLNNTENEIVTLYDKSGVEQDTYSYDLTADYCHLKPTEGETNDEKGTGIGSGCTGGVPGNKSYARIPDGTGDWVDPIPTPGTTNVEGNEDTLFNMVSNLLDDFSVAIDDEISTDTSATSEITSDENNEESSSTNEDSTESTTTNENIENSNASGSDNEENLTTTIEDATNESNESNGSELNSSESALSSDSLISLDNTNSSESNSDTETELNQEETSNNSGETESSLEESENNLEENNTDTVNTTQDDNLNITNENESSDSSSDNTNSSSDSNPETITNE